MTTRLMWLGIGLIGAIATSATEAIAQSSNGSELTAPSLAVEQSDPPSLTEPGTLTPLEQSVIDEMNLARQNPEFYADLLIERRQYYNGAILEIPGQPRLLTQEGIAAVDEAIAFLQRIEPLPPLTFSPGMSSAAADHAADLAPGRLGHVGSDGSLPSTRLNQYGIWDERMGENISYGSDTARDVVLELIIDDGVASRGHRETMFGADYAQTGVGCDRHTVYRTVCVITYAVSYQEAEATATAPTPSESSAVPIGQRSSEKLEPPNHSSSAVPRYRLGR